MYDEALEPTGYNQQIPNLYERPEDVSRALFETEQQQDKVVDTDTTKANFNPLEMRSFRAVAGLVSLLNYIERRNAWDLSELKQFYESENSISTVSSRAKNGWASSLAKTVTNVNVQEVKDRALEIQAKFDSEKKRGMLSGIKSKIIGR